MWLYVPPEYCPSVPEAEDSTWASNSLPQLLAQSVTLNGKHSPSRSWLRRLKKDSWTQLLFGTICEPSRADLGVARWIGSLADSPANPTVTPASERERPTTGTSGQTLPESSEKSDPGFASWKTFQESQNITSTELGQSYRQWVTELRKESSQRRKSARLMFENACSLWPWPTLMTKERPNQQVNVKNGYKNMMEAAELLWLTPNASFSTSDKGEWNGTYYVREDGTKVNSQLSHQAAHWLWPTATVTGNRNHMGASDKAGTGLETAAALWPTAIAGDSEKGASRYGTGNQSLSSAAKNWPTAVASDADKRGEGENSRPDSRLAYVANRWQFPTPLEQDGSKESKFNGGDRRSPTLAYYVRCSPPNQENPKPGHTCSTKCRRLNPLFVEMLMGWPMGLTLLSSALTDSELSAMEWSHWWRRMGFAFSLLSSN